MLGNTESSIHILNTPAEVVKKIVSSYHPGVDFPFSKNPKDINYFAVLFYLLLDSMSTMENTVIIESKQLNIMATLQNALNRKNAKITFSVLPPNAKTATIDQVQDENERKAAMREDLQQAMIIGRQYSQILMTQASAKVNVLQVDGTENSNELKTQSTITESILKMNQSQ